MHKFEYSLIVATLGRKNELALLLESLHQQLYSSKNFEIIIVDQNEIGFLDEILGNYSEKLNIVLIRTDKKSLSSARNLGIAQATGKYLLFPDDDCLYYSDTLLMIHNFLTANKGVDVLLGTVYNRDSKQFVFKTTPTKICKVSLSNYHNFVSSIAIVVKNEAINFDEQFGIGEKYFSNEDADLLVRQLKALKRVVYSPDVQFFHPPYNAGTMSSEKLFRYGIGFGALVRKHLSPQLLWLFFKVLVFQLLKMMQALLSLNFNEVARRFTAFKGRIKGFVIYRAA